MPEIAYRSILVPVFGSKLDDDIVATAGRLAAAEAEADGEGEARLAPAYVVEVPLADPIDAELPPELEEAARAALQRAREVAEEYEDVAVSTETVRARRVGAGIGAAKPAEIGAATEFVLKKAPCRVLLTAPPEDAQAPRTSAI